jgi:hypothetical protein
LVNGLSDSRKGKWSSGPFREIWNAERRIVKIGPFLGHCLKQKRPAHGVLYWTRYSLTEGFDIFDQPICGKKVFVCTADVAFTLEFNSLSSELHLYEFCKHSEGINSISFLAINFFNFLLMTTVSIILKFYNLVCLGFRSPENKKLCCARAKNFSVLRLWLINCTELSEFLFGN